MNQTITFSSELTERLNGAFATANAAVAEAAIAAYAQDTKVTVRSFAAALRAAAPMLGTANAVLAAAVKAAKAGKSLLAVSNDMADAADKKRRDDAKRAAEKAAAAPGKALARAEAKVNECQLALRTPLERALDDLAEASEAVKSAAAALREARAARRAARAALVKLVKAAASAALAEAKKVEPAKAEAKKAEPAKAEAKKAEPAKAA